MSRSKSQALYDLAIDIVTTTINMHRVGTDPRAIAGVISGYIEQFDIAGHRAVKLEIRRVIRNAK